MYNQDEYNAIVCTNQQKQLIICDWLTLNVTDVFKDLEFNEEQQFIANGLVLTLCDYRTRQFNRVAEVHYEGRKVATVTFESSSKIMLRDQAHIKFENYLFYEDAVKDLALRIVETFGISSVKTSRLDLACDGVWFHDFMRTFLIEKDGYDLGVLERMTVNRVRDLDNIRPFQTTREHYSRRTFDSFTVGEKGSKTLGKSKSYRFARYYNKTAEIANSGKDYISEWHQMNGFEGDVFRYEVQLSSSYISEIEGFVWTDIFDYDKLVGLFMTAQKQFFEFYYPVKNNVTHCPRVELFPALQPTALYCRVKRVVKDKVRTIKIAVKRIVKECYVGTLRHVRTTRETALKMMHDLVNHYDLEQWFMSSWDSLWREIKQVSNKHNIILHSEQLRLWEMQ